MNSCSNTPTALSRRREITREEFEAQTREEIIRRARLYHLCATSDRFRAAQIRLCKALGPKYFINNFVWTYDPRTARKHYPLRMFPRQEQFIDWLDERKKANDKGHCDKSRDQGATWLMVAHAVFYFLFEPGFIARFGSITETKVDDFTPDSILGKARYVLEYLPSFMRPAIIDGEHNKHLVLSHPTSGALIKGESMNLGFGRSGRATVTYMDEFAHVRNSSAVLASVSQTAKCIIMTSTPLGMGNEFGRIKKENKLSTFSLHWSDNPLWTKARYEAEADILEDWMVAQELDISYERSTGNRYYKKFSRQYHVAKSVIHMDHDARQYVFWDFGHGGAMALLFIQVTAEGDIQVWADYEVTDQDVDFCLPISRGRRPLHYSMLKKTERDYIDKVLKKVAEGYEALHGGDNSGKAKTANSKRSCKDAIEKEMHTWDEGARFISTGKQAYDWRHKCVDNILKVRQNQENEWMSRLQVSPDCERFIECMFNASYDGSNPHTDNPKPKLDQFFHMVSAFEFFCINLFPVSETTGFKEKNIR